MCQKYPFSVYTCWSIPRILLFLTEERDVFYFQVYHRWPGDVLGRVGMVGFGRGPNWKIWMEREKEASEITLDSNWFEWTSTHRSAEFFLFYFMIQNRIANTQKNALISCCSQWCFKLVISLVWFGLVAGPFWLSLTHSCFLLLTMALSLYRSVSL